MKKLFIRYVIFFVGLLFTGFGIALSTKIGLGTTPISVIPLVISKRFSISFGMVANILALTFVSAEFLIRKKGFTKDLVIQLLIAPFFGLFIDLGFKTLSNISHITFLVGIGLLLTGCIIMAFGIFLQVFADVTVNPYEGLVLAIAERTNKKFDDVKIIVDIGVMFFGILLSIIVFGEIKGVGIATVVVAIGTGNFIKVFKKAFEYAGIAK